MELRLAFEAVDADGSGFITANELKKLFKDSGHGNDVSDTDIDELIKACDTDKDNKISFEEFVKAFCG